MLKHLRYLKYVLVHKLAIIRPGREFGVSWWRLLVHDLSKFLPDEWFPYVNHFYGKRLTPESVFRTAWAKHVGRNMHHWENWYPCEMPDMFTREMVADWIAAGIAKGAKSRKEVEKWYEENRDRICLRKQTRTQVEFLIRRYVQCGAV